MAKPLGLWAWITRLTGVVFLILLAYSGYFAYSMATGKERMTDICLRIKPGMTIEALASLAEEHGLGPRRQLNPETRLAYLAESRTMGRHACRVQLESGIVTDAVYNFAD